MNKFVFEFLMEQVKGDAFIIKILLNVCCKSKTGCLFI